MNGQCIVIFATPQQMTQLMLVAENKINYDKDNKPQWKNDSKGRKFTPVLTMAKSGGWNQEGLDYLEFPRLWDKTKGSKKGDKTNEIPDTQEVLVGHHEDNLDLLCEGIESDGETEEKWPVKAVYFIT
eukprot:11823854-Ditylum_brightwellii.AAC.1